MRSGAWLWLPVALAFSGCQDGYPIAPTACDRYCHATKDLQCGFYEPSGCVLACERDGKSSADCIAQLEATTACFEKTPGAADAYCRYQFEVEPPCTPEVTALQQCYFMQLGFGNR